MATFLVFLENNGQFNMDTDFHILKSAINSKEKEPVIRLYGWKPKCVSVGRNQSFEHINMKYCNYNNIDIVRRITGGRGLLHDNEITYSFVCPVKFLQSGESVISSYKEISNAIIKGFKILGVNLCIGGNKKHKTSFDYCMSLSTGADLCYRDKKIIGSAQYRTQDYLLQHGSILFSYNTETIENIFNEKVNPESITTINEINNNISKKDVIECLKRGFQEYFSLFFSKI